MRLFVTDTLRMSKAMARVENAFRTHAPSWGANIVEKEEDADLVLLHVIGYPETVEAVKRIRNRGQRVALMQYCFRSTQEPFIAPWAAIWLQCAGVWSYYDLHREAQREGEKLNAVIYHAPLGVDPVFCQPVIEAERPIKIMTSGYVAESEAILECAEAARRHQQITFHLGPPNLVRHLPHVVNDNSISDPDLRRRYQQCQFVAGLRRAEGFELPVVEGLMNGCRPICFDKPHYRDWFSEFALFVPEVHGEPLIHALERAMATDRPVTYEERQKAFHKFNWKPLVLGFLGSLVR